MSDDRPRPPPPGPSLLSKALGASSSRGNALVSGVRATLQAQRPDGLTEQGGQGGKGITKQARNAQRYIEARAVEHGEWENLNPRHAL